jgi:hypothetical protein
MAFDHPAVVSGPGRDASGLYFSYQCGFSICCSQQLPTTNPTTFGAILLRRGPA